MTNLVEQINDGIEARLASVLGASYSELKYKIDISKNNYNSNSKRYGSLPKGMEEVSGVLGAYTVDQGYEVILTHNYKTKGAQNDVDQREKTFLLYDKLDSIIKDLYNTKAGLPALIANIKTFAADEPEYLEEDSVVVLRTLFVINYRALLT